MRMDLNVDSYYSSVTFLNQRTTLFEWYVVKCGFKSGYRKDVCFEEIGLCHAQCMLIVLDPIVNIIGGIDMTI